MAEMCSGYKNIFFLTIDLWEFIGYTWQVVGDGGGERRACGRDPPWGGREELAGGTHPRAARALELGS